MSEAVKGEVTDRCPWRVFESPVVSDVLSAWEWFESGQVALRLGPNPPYYLIEGVEVYQSAIQWARNEQRAHEREISEASRKHASAHSK